jgi:hypothetical protein
MIEAIKKEVEGKSLYYDKEDNELWECAGVGFPNNGRQQVIGVDELYEILDKYNTQPDYKKMWEELKETFEKPFKEAKTEEEYIVLGMSGMSGMLEQIIDLERKYNIK